MQEDQRRRAAVALITAKYLRYVDEHKSDEGFSNNGMGTTQELRQAVFNANFIRKTATGLELTQQGKDALRSAGATGL
jgi:hypothetical protein